MKKAEIKKPGFLITPADFAGTPAKVKKPRREAVRAGNGRFKRRG